MDNFSRDLQWGQALQLVEERSEVSDEGTNCQPKPFFVEEDEELVLDVRFSEDSAVLQVIFSWELLFLVFLMLFCV